MTNADPQGRSRLVSGVAVLLLLLMGVLAGGAARHESVAFDEVAHIGAGISYLQKFDLRMNEEHPPLPKLIAALPLVVRGVRADYSHISWTASQKFLPDGYVGQWVFGHWLITKWNDPFMVLAWTRFPMLLLTLALGWLIFTFGRELGGDWGGLLSLSVFVSSPLFLTFGAFVITDTAIAFFSLGVLWSFAHVWQDPSRKRFAIFGVWLGCALLSKFSAAVLFPAFILFALSTRWRAVPGQPAAKPDARAWRRLRWRATGKGIALAAALVYVVYLIFSWNQSHEVLYLLGGSSWMSPIKRLLMPPWLYVRGMAVIAFSFVRPMYILGKGYPHGKWFYFPVLLALKLTLGSIVLAITTMMFAVARRRMKSAEPVIPVHRRLHWRVLWIALVTFLGVHIFSMFDVSLRHLSVPHVLFFLMLAPLPRMIAEFSRGKHRSLAFGISVVVVIAAVSSLYTAVRAYPHYMPYFNSFAFGRPAYFLASDSNVDWNQALPDAKAFLEQHGQHRVSIDTYAFSDPAAFVPNAEMWDCQKPTAVDAGQWVVVSSDMILDVHNCEWLLQYPQVKLAGGGMYAFQLPSPVPAAGTPGGPPVASAQRQMFGMPVDMRPYALGVIQHPETMPAVIADMTKQMTSGKFPPKPEGR